jgi:hypothetical protein
MVFANVFVNLIAKIDNRLLIVAKALVRRTYFFCDRIFVRGWYKTKFERLFV